MSRYSLKHLPDSTLVREFKSAVAHECQNAAIVIAYLAEVDARRLYAPAGYASMYEH